MIAATAPKVSTIASDDPAVRERLDALRAALEQYRVETGHGLSGTIAMRKALAAPDDLQAGVKMEMKEAA